MNVYSSLLKIYKHAYACPYCGETSELGSDLTGWANNHYNCLKMETAKKDRLTPRICKLAKIKEI